MLQNIVSHIQPQALHDVAIHIATTSSLITEADPPPALATLRIQLRKPASKAGSEKGELKQSRTNEEKAGGEKEENAFKAKRREVRQEKEAKKR